MSEALSRILKDANGRLGRLTERYVKERDNGTLDPVEAQALCKVFEKDVFIVGMLAGRYISEHIQKRSGGGPVIRQKNNSPIPLTAETSAGSFFAGCVVMLYDPQGKIFYSIIGSNFKRPSGESSAR